MKDKNLELKKELPIIVLTGPTASGKTSLSLALASGFRGEIICADSMTVYKSMNIGTDKPTLLCHSELDSESMQKELNSGSESGMTIQGIPHHLIDILNPDEEFNVAIFKELTEKIIKEIHSRGNIPFLVGGSTMYIDALVYGYNIPHAKPNPGLRKKLEKKSNGELFRQLIELDPDAEWTVDKNNKRRLIRALEVCIQTGKPFTQQKTKRALPQNVLYLAIKRDREELYKRINKRVDEMMAEGFLEEVKKLHKKYDLNTAMQATGYRQLVQYLEGEISLEEAVEKTKQSHRNYAKRQLTWLNRNKDVIWIREKKEAEGKISDFFKR
ncbi:tRNA (adenosine(37)-N6)-dimethylallyltransferase MiaA [candidate division WS5 bacterium]|uniref:tRNA dimethylallyltransferase n=1 Tax=candidate division WS5 bacterium TaxID=2093353 RepID=A0A419DAU7_9BACT|nr:MAG: tRNA (adenosine(37)-N6)-dimethylallyltransferase MiaA [candidate division WS5 bacterium]